MFKSVSETSFMYDGQLVDTVKMTYDSRNCGGANIHTRGNVLMTLTCIAQELFLGISAEDDEDNGVLMRRTLRKWKEIT